MVDQSLPVSRGRRLAWLVLGWTLVLLSVPVGLLPGPGGVFVFAPGAAILLRHSHWARRSYVRAARRWPRLGRVGDRALRRPVLPRARRGRPIDSHAPLP